MWSADVAGVLGCELRTSRGSWDVEYRLVWVLECGVQMSLRCGDVECGHRMSPGYRDVECGCRVGIGIHGERTSRVPGIWSTDVAWVLGCTVQTLRGCWEVECWDLEVGAGIEELWTIF